MSMLRQLSHAPSAYSVRTMLSRDYVRRNPLREKSTNLSIGIRERILRETKISTDHMTPEIALQLITPECPLYHKAIVEDRDRVFENDPFWGFYWPGGQALSRYILDHPEVVRDKRVLDVGSGCGASSLAALMRGAKYSVANDIDTAAGVAAHLNASLNNIRTDTVRICEENLIGQKVPEDLIFLGDVFYDEEFAEALIPWLQRLHREQKATILVGDPGRHGLTASHLAFMERLATYELTENCCIENHGFKFVNVWRFK